MKKLLKEGLHNPTFMIGVAMVISIIIAAVFAKQIAPYSYDYIDMDNVLKAPGGEYLFGTDNLGRDVFSRIIFGSQIALSVAGIAVCIQLLIGVSVGLLSGYFGKWIDNVLSFFTDLTWAMPPLIMALAVITALGPGLNNVIISIAVVSWAQFARIVRAKTQALKNLPFVETGIAFGEKHPAIMFSYILPNIIPSIIVIATVSIPNTILSTTSLGFLGLGAQSPSPDWGLALSDGLTYITAAPWLSIFPGLALAYTVLAFTLFGEGLRDVLDPRLKL